MIDVCFIAAYVAFGLAVLCAVCALRYAVRKDLRAVLDDLSGKRRAQGLEEQASARLAGSGVRGLDAYGPRVGEGMRKGWQVALEDDGEERGDGDGAGVADAGATELGCVEAQTELGVRDPDHLNGVAAVGGQDGLTRDEEVR